jgi:methylenetetrahydrofolate reductase (NADPH)
LLADYQQIGVDRIVALRGDVPSGMVGRGEFGFANELVAFIRETTGDRFRIEVAAYPEYHPEAPSPTADLANFKKKVEAGADSAITQYFYSPDAYLRFVEACQSLGLNIPIVPGIMPITNFRQLARFSDHCGAEIPRWIRKKLEEYQDDLPSLRAFGLDVITRLCAELLGGGAPGLHVYTLNKYKPSREIWKRLGL